MFIEKPRLLFATTSSIVFIIGYFVILDGSSDPRFTDHALTLQEAAWWEMVLIFAFLASVFATWISAMRHSYRLGRKVVSALIFLIWPLSFLYGFWNLRGHQK